MHTPRLETASRSRGLAAFSFRLDSISAQCVIAASLTLTCCSCQSVTPTRPSIAPTHFTSSWQGKGQTHQYASSPLPSQHGTQHVLTSVEQIPSSDESLVVGENEMGADAGSVQVGYDEPVSRVASRPANTARLGNTVRTSSGSRPARRRLPPCASCGPVSQPTCSECGLGCPDRFHAEDEYICDGGDEDPQVLVGQDWTVRGLNPEDTVVHFDTVDGRRLVEASNRVCLYAPRFASVRKVTGVGLHEQLDRAVGVDRPTRAQLQDERLPSNTVVQPLQAGRNLSIKGPGAFRERRQGVAFDQSQMAARVDNEFVPYENFDIIRRGQYNTNEKARLSAGLQAAITWTHDLGVQVVIDEVSAALAIGHSKPQEFNVYETPPGTGGVRIVKVASRDDAHPGDIIEFTLRFDNVGEHPIGNVTIVDNLTTRLEYVPDSAHCTLKSDFYSRENESELLALRWEIHEPIKVGEGGIIRFKCRVR